jgi:hypothetical protein
MTSFKLNINNRKWLISGLYRTPSLSESEFTKGYTKTFDKTTTKNENFLILGDLSYDMLVNEKCTALNHKQGQTLHKLPNHHHTGFCSHAKSGNHLL